ncbi:sperm flagellar protein 2 [Sorex araneus]|uniref:sperm flagellar protein 2 n=1 Tax=Sorex araneus TaxID=42254 RepID=UPI00033157D8|nr:sperm flagellar protein 2 [Sorex araneus]
MSEILCQWLNQDLKVSQTVTPKSFAKAFSSGYLIGEVLHKFELQDDFSEFSESRVSSAKLNNFSRLEPTLHRLGVQFDQNIAHSIITEKPGVATKLLYQMYIALQKKKKSGLTGVEITSVQPLASVKLQNMKSEAFRDRLRNLIPRQTDFSLMQVSHRFQEKYKKKEELDHMHFEKFEKVQKFKEDQRCVDVKKQRLSKRRQNEIMAQIQAAIIQIPKPAPSRAFKALEAQKLMKKKKEAEDVANEIKKFEALIKKDLQAKESASKPPLDTSGQTATDLLNTYSDDDYIKKIQKRLEEDAFAREQREKRRRRLLMDQLIAHEAQEEAYREEQLINRLMRQSQQERRIAVQLMHVRHEKEVLWQNRIFREKQYEERRLKDFQDALDREAALAKQAKMNSEEQALREKEVHDKISVERAQARYEKHYSFCAEILDQILDLSTKVADYRMLTNNLIPEKMMHDWKELFFNGKPIYEQASLKPLQTKLTGDQLIEMEKRDLLDKNDFDDYKNLHGEWTVSEELADNLPASNNSILGHIIHRLIDKSLPSKTESKMPESPSFALKGCLLGKTFSGKTTVLKFLQKEFPIRVLSIDTLVQEAIQAYHNKETVIMDQSAEKESEEIMLTIPPDSGKNAEHSSNEFSANSLSNESLKIEDKTLSKNGQKTPKDIEVKPSETTSYFSVRANLGEKSENMLKKGKSIPDILLVSIMANAIHQIPMNQGWILDGFPMTLNQAKLLEEALTGYSRSLQEQETERSQTSVLAVDPASSKEVIPQPSAFDFVLLLNVSDSCSLSRMNQNMAEPDLKKSPQEDINQRTAAEKQDEDGDKNLRAQIQHRIVGFLDNWPSLEQWFTEPKNILIPVNAEVDEQSLCKKVKEIFMTEMVKKQDEVKAYLERKENELKEVPAEPATSPVPSPEPEKEKETPSRGERSKPSKGRRASESQQSKPQSPQEGKRKKGDPSLKRKGSPRGKSAGVKAPVKTEASELQLTPVKPPPPKPGSDDWIYVNEPIPEEICSFLVPYWQLIENSYIDNVKIVLRHLREDQHTILAYFYDIRTNFQQFLRRPDYKQDFVSQWQADFNSLPDDLWDDEETKCELHQRVNDLRDRLWDICDARKEEAEQECTDIINESWLQDMIELTTNHFFSLMQAELNRFQDTKRFLQDYYRGMEGKIPVEDNKKFIRVPLIQGDNKDLAESQVRIPLVPRVSISPDSIQPKPKTKIEFALESVETSYESDEKLITDTWQQVSLAVSQMVAAEIHQRLEEEKESLQVDQKEKPPPVTMNKKGKKESPKLKKEEKKGKGKPVASAEHSPIILSAEEMAEMEKRNELRSKIKEEHFASLQIEEANTLFRLQLIKTKALGFLRDLTTKAVNMYKQMEHWLGQRYLKEMASVEKLTEVARYHIETSTRIQNELYLGQEDFFIDGNIKVFPDPPPPKRPPPVEKEENITLTIKQLDNLRNQFLSIAPKAMIGSKDFTDILLDSINLNLGSNNVPNSWMHLTQPELQELTCSLTVNSEFVDWRKFLLATSMPWPMPSEEELLETLKRFKAADVEQSGTVTLQQYEQAGLWFVGEEDVKIPEDPLEPLPFSRQKHLIEFFFRLFADYEKDPPLLDYTEMLLYFACHPNPIEGVYRALSVAIGTHVFPPVKTGVAAEKVSSSTHVNATEQYSELNEKNINDERQLKEAREGKESEISEHANMEKISIDTLLKVFRGGSEAQDSNRFGNHPRKRNIYLESFKKTFHDLGAKNLEPIEVAVLLKHPFIQDLILTYPDYKIPDIKTIFQRSLHAQGSDGESSPSRLTEEKK